ncbi:MAG TPA: NAD(P)-binding domain-containing protein, partial [Nocardioides sp.]|nr:NAD(P)-binding domain-containing protein [Nocardioides sp.]
MTTTVGFIGLGIMGAPMATNLVGAGFDVVGHNRSPAKTNALVARGGRAAATVAEAARDADVVVTMLPDSTDVLDVVLGEGGVLAHAHEGQLLIDMSTVAPEASREIAAAAAGVGVRALDAPVSGGEAGAVEGSLSIMVGGDAATFEEARPVFEAMGKTIVLVGPASAGQTVKACNQVVVALAYQAISEALVLGAKAGVEPAKII